MNLQQSKYIFIYTLLALLFPGLLHSAFAESTIQCHCFKNRRYNAAEKFAADEYILATSFNSLLARSFALPKRQIVMIKMNEGVSQDDLLISLKISKATGIDPRELFRLRKEKNTWAAIISGLEQQKKITNDPLLEALIAGIPVEQVGIRAAEEIMSEFYRIAPEEIKKLGMSGLDVKEMNLVFILAYAREQRPEALVELYKQKGKSWSEIAFNLGVEPKMAGNLVQAYPARAIKE